MRVKEGDMRTEAELRVKLAMSQGMRVASKNWEKARKLILP